MYILYIYADFAQGSVTRVHKTLHVTSALFVQTLRCHRGGGGMDGGRVIICWAVINNSVVTAALVGLRAPGFSPRRIHLASDGVRLNG